MKKDILVVPKRFFDDPERHEAYVTYDAELGRLTDAIVRLPIDTDDWQELQRNFNSARTRMEVIQLLAYLVTADSRYNKNILIQRRVDKAPTLEQCKTLLEEVKETVFRWPVEASFQRNNVLLHRIHYLNRIQFEE